MGVTVLYPYPLPENKTGAQTIEVLTKRILAVREIKFPAVLNSYPSYSLPELRRHSGWSIPC